MVELINTGTAEEIATAIIDTRRDEPDRGSSQWNIEDHAINDKHKRPDKHVKDRDGNVSRVKEVNRISVSFQQLIVNTSVAFGFGNDVTISSNAENTEEQELLDEIQIVLFDNKETTMNQRVATELYKETEVAELWYMERDGDRYAIRSFVMSPSTKDKLYPIFDGYGKMLAFARMYTDKEDVKMTVWTSDEILELVKNVGGWDIENRRDNPYGKIPIVYGSQDHTEWHVVQSQIERLELLLSNHAEINDYHAAPKLFVKGRLKSLPKAGEGGGVLQGEEGTDVSVISWDSATDSVKLEIDNLINSIHKFTQTPDISFENVKGLNQASGVMLKMLFMDAHLKVMRKRGIWDEYFTRRYSVLKSMINYRDLGRYGNAIRTLRLSPVFTPYMIDDLRDKVATLMAANGGRPIMTHRRSIELLGSAVDVDEEMELIREEEDDMFDRRMSEPIGII